MSTVKILRVDVDATTEVLHVQNNLDGLKAAIGGGWLEPIAATDGLRGWTAYLDEEGKIKGMGVNVAATYLARSMGWASADVLCGPVIFLGPVDHEGDETDVANIVLTAARAQGILP
jgi:hypothetical protein